MLRGPAPALRGVPRRRLHGRGAAGGGGPVVALPERPAAARQGHRPDRRGGRGGQAEGQGRAQDRARRQAARRQQGDRDRRRHHGAHPAEAGRGRRSQAAAGPGGRPARAKIFGQDAAVERVAQAIKMNRAGLGQPRAADRLLPVRRADGRRQDRARQAARRDPGRRRSSASTCRSTWSGTRCRASSARRPATSASTRAAC